MDFDVSFHMRHPNTGECVELKLGCCDMCIPKGPILTASFRTAAAVHGSQKREIFIKQPVGIYEGLV